MTNERTIRDLLKSAAKRVTEKQPDEIRLSAAPAHKWSNAAVVEGYAKPLLARGFTDVGTYTVDVLPVAIRFLLKAAERIYAAIYDHPKAGIWLNLVALHEDGTSITFSTTRDRGLEKRPGHSGIHFPGASAAQLYSVALRKSPTNTPRKALTPDSVIGEFEKAWADGVRWRKSYGFSMAEVASVILSQGGRPARALRPERIEFVAEQDGEPEHELKASLAEILDQQGSVEKAYLARVRYDQAPETQVALCLKSGSPKDAALLEAIRKVFARLFDRQSHLDIIFVVPSDVTRLESICRAFYERTRLLH
jgi:hypothetical protein